MIESNVVVKREAGFSKENSFEQKISFFLAKYLLKGVRSDLAVTTTTTAAAVITITAAVTTTTATVTWLEDTVHLLFCLSLK